MDFPDEVRVVTHYVVPSAAPALSVGYQRAALALCVERRRAALVPNVVVREVLVVSPGLDPCAVAQGALGRQSAAPMDLQFVSARCRVQASSAQVAPPLRLAAALSSPVQALTNLAWMRSASWFAPARLAAALGP